jgi:competence protein ComEC
MWLGIFDKRVHEAWVIAWFSAGIIAGIALSSVVRNSIFGGVEALVCSGLVLIICLRKRRKVLLLPVLLTGVVFGLWRGGLEHKALAGYEPYYGKQLRVQGTISMDTVYGAQGDQRLQIQDVQIDGHKLAGVVWVSTPTTAQIKRGDKILLEGTVSKGFGNVPASIYSAKIVAVLRPVPGDIARRVRDWFTEGVRRAIPEPEASLSVGYLVGQRAVLSETLNDQLRIVGLTHAVVASGYNLTILVGFMRRLLAKYSKYMATLSAAVMITGFVLITGFSPSMSRAGLVSLLSLVAWYYGRSIHPVVLLFISAAITAVWRPVYVWGDIGWYLSFTAFTGVIVLAPLLQRYFWGHNAKVGVLRQTLLDTIAAQLLTMPIILYSFGQYATYALLANILVLPLVPLAMLLTFVAGVAGLAIPNFSEWFGFPARIILACNLLVVSKVARLPGAHGEVNFGIRPLIISYVILLVAMVYLWRVTAYNFRQSTDQAKLTLY